MVKQDWKAFSELIMATARITNNKEIIRSEQAILLMFQALAEYSLKEIQQAVARHLRSDEGKFFPTVSHILTQINGTDTEKENEAWRLFLHTVDHHGYYENVVFPERAYHWAIDQLGGWVKVSNDFLNMDDRERQFRKKEFVSLYRAGKRRATPNNTKPYLKGFYAIDNETRGYLDYVPTTAIAIGTGEKISLVSVQAALLEPEEQRQLPAGERVKNTLTNIVQRLAEGARVNDNEVS